MLHTVNKPPLRTSTLKSVLKTAGEGDPILLIEDGVHAARKGAATEALLHEALKKHPVFALEPDLRARGISVIIEGIKPIGYDGFVELVEKNQVVAWT